MKALQEKLEEHHGTKDGKTCLRWFGNVQRRPVETPMRKVN